MNVCSICHAEAQPKHLDVERSITIGEETIRSQPRFFAALCFAQNDKVDVPVEMAGILTGLVMLFGSKV